MFYQNKVWRTESWRIADPHYERLESIYPQLNHFDSIDSVFTLVERNRKLRYCFIIQESTYFLYFTQQDAPSIRHDPFTNQVFLRKGDLGSLVLAADYANLFINPIFCAMILPAHGNNVIFFFFGYYTKYTNCEARLEFRSTEFSNQTNTLTSTPTSTPTSTIPYPVFILTKECKVFRQDRSQSNDRQECRFLASKRSSVSNSSEEHNLVVLGQRTSLYLNFNLTHENFFKNMFKHRADYRSFWDCPEISYRDYNTIKFIVLPTFTMFTISFMLFNSLLAGREEAGRRRFHKQRRIHRMHQRIRADYLKRSSAD